MFPFRNVKLIFYEELTCSDDIKFFANFIIKLTHFQHTLMRLEDGKEIVTKEMVGSTHNNPK
jgi:hypothetical protein